MSDWEDVGGDKHWLVVGELRAVVRPVGALSMSGVVRAYEWMIDGAAYERWIVPPSASMTLDEAKAAAEQVLREMHDDAEQERAARLYALRLDALDEGCDGPECSCHARRAAAIEELTALRRTETP